MPIELSFVVICQAGRSPARSPYSGPMYNNSYTLCCAARGTLEARGQPAGCEHVEFELFRDLLGPILMPAMVVICTKLMRPPFLQ